MDESPRSQGSHLFTVRVWAEAPRAGQVEWRGKVQHVLSGEARYFRDWPTLIAFLMNVVGWSEGDRRPGDPDGQPQTDDQ
jgi:hypothetical protein